MYYDVQKSADRIRKLRENRNLTQNEAAEQMGFSFGDYRKLERGLNGGSIDSLMLVADGRDIIGTNQRKPSKIKGLQMI